MNKCIPLPHQHIKLSLFLSVLEKCVLSACWRNKRRETENSYFAAERLLTCGTGTGLGFCSETGGLWTSRRSWYFLQADLLSWADCCQISNRFAHSRRLGATLPKTPAGGKKQQHKNRTAISPSWARAHQALCFWQSCPHMAGNALEDQQRCLAGHTCGCAKKRRSGIELLFWQL